VEKKRGRRYIVPPSGGLDFSLIPLRFSVRCLYGKGLNMKYVNSNLSSDLAKKQLRRCEIGAFMSAKKQNNDLGGRIQFCARDSNIN